MKLKLDPKFEAFKLLNRFVEEFLGPTAMPAQFNNHQADTMHKYKRIFAEELTKEEYQPEPHKVAERCAQIAERVSASYDEEDGFPSHHAVGAETVAVTIRKELLGQ